MLLASQASIDDAYAPEHQFGVPATGSSSFARGRAQVQVLFSVLLQARGQGAARVLVRQKAPLGTASPQTANHDRPSPAPRWIRHVLKSVASSKQERKRCRKENRLRLDSRSRSRHSSSNDKKVVAFNGLLSLGERILCMRGDQESQQWHMESRPHGIE